MRMTKRTFLSNAAAALSGLAFGAAGAREATRNEVFEVTHTAAQWRALLSPQQYAVLRESGTERSGSSALNGEHRQGIYECAGCALPLYSSAAKFESGTGWPSFTAPLDHAVRTQPDPGLFGNRTEVHCRRCGGHLGHVFDDGPPPTGLRYCMNGVAMNFIPMQPR